MLHVQTFTFGPFQENTCLLYDETGEAVIVDPGCYSASEQIELSAFIKEKKLQLKQLLNTHCHVDHVAGNRYIFDTYGLLPYIHLADLPILQNQAQVSAMYGLPCDPSPEPGGFFNEGDTIRFGTTTLEILHTPGHAPGHVVFYHREQNILINGDVLFKGSIGRTDLPMGNHGILIASIKNKLFNLPDNTIVYCGHGPETTIGEEKRFNPFLN